MLMYSNTNAIQIYPNQIVGIFMRMHDYICMCVLILDFFVYKISNKGNYLPLNQ